eukprot:g3595.t1
MYELVADAEILCENLSSAAIDIIFAATNVEEKGADHNANNRDNALERFEFLETVVRMALEKSPGTPPPEAIDTLLNDFLLRHAERTHPYDFRKEHLYFQEVENVFLAFWGDLRVLFATYCDVLPAGRSGNPKTHLSVSGLALLYNEANYLDEDFTREEIKLTFVLSQSIFKNEMKTTAHTMLSWVDFLEALGRSIQYRSLPPDFSDPEDDPRPAHIKIALALNMIIRGLKPSHRAKKKDGDKDEDDGAAGSGSGGGGNDPGSKEAALAKLKGNGLTLLGLKGDGTELKVGRG